MASTTRWSRWTPERTARPERSVLRRDTGDDRVEPRSQLGELDERGRLPLGPGIACRQRMLEGAQLDLMLRELALDGRPPGVDLPAPIGLGVIRRELIGAQTALEIDSGTPESREPGSDLAIGHVAIVRIRIPATRPGGTGGGYWRATHRRQIDDDGGAGCSGQRARGHAREAGLRRAHRTGRGPVH